MSDWAEAKNKARQGVEWTDYANVPMGDETYEIPYGLLSGDQFLDVYGRIDIEAIREHQDASELNERVQELQDKDDLTDEEEAELQELHEQIEAESAELVGAIGSETLEAIRDAGKMALKPDEDDVNDTLALSSGEQEDRFGHTVRTRREARDAIEQEMREVVSDSPYLIAYTVGQKAFEESQRLVGN